MLATSPRKRGEVKKAPPAQTQRALCTANASFTMTRNPLTSFPRSLPTASSLIPLLL